MNLKKNKGITLIALVITIIVLLILAGITISTLIGENGILTRAEDSKIKNEVGTEKEQIAVSYNACKASNLGGTVTAEKLQEEMTKGGYKATVTEGVKKLIITYEETGHIYTINQQGKITEDYVLKVATLDTGTNINTKMSNLAQNINNIKAILYSSEQPDISTMTEDNIISTSDSENPVYCWYENETIYWWSEAECPILNEDSSAMFSGLANVEDISGITTFDASKVKNMNYMFNYMHNIKDFSPISNWNVEIVEMMIGTFYSCNSLCSLDLKNWNVENLTNMTQIFTYSKFKEINISGWNISNINTLYMLFSNCTELEKVNLSGINTENVTNFQYIFQNCQKLENIIGIETLKVGKGKEFFYMFTECPLIKTLNLSKWDMKSATNIKDMIYHCSGLESLNISNWNLESLTTLEDYIFQSVESQKLKTFKADNWKLPNATSIQYAFYGIGYRDYNTNKEIALELNVNNWDIPNVTNAYYFLAFLKDDVNTINIKNWNAPKLENMEGFFTYGQKVKTIDMSGWTTGSLTKLASLIEGNNSLENMSGWGELNISTVTDLSQMAGDCKALTNISELENWNVSNVQKIEEIFRNCTLLEDFSPVNYWDLTKAIEYDSSFDFCRGSAGNPQFTKVQGTWNDGYFTAN